MSQRCKRVPSFDRPSRNGVTPVDIAREILRLYPPTRHVYRDFSGEVARADIEGCHHSELLGGDDPLVFRPERWQEICREERKVQGCGRQAVKNLKVAEEKLGFMPFAYWCTADGPETAGFGYKMITLLVAVLCRDLGKEYPLKDPESVRGRDEGPLDSKGTAYEQLIVEMPLPC
jgi:hypothetical protein